MGIVLVYRANRVINFAQAELGAVAAVVAVHLGVQRGWPYVAAVAVGLTLATVTGVLIDTVVIRRLRNAWV